MQPPLSKIGRNANNNICEKQVLCEFFNFPKYPQINSPSLKIHVQNDPIYGTLAFPRTGAKYSRKFLKLLKTEIALKLFKVKISRFQDSYDFKTYTFAIELLLRHLTYSRILPENKQALKGTLATEPTLKILIESLPSHHEKFSTECTPNQLLKLHGKLMRIVNITCRSSNCRKQITNVNEETVSFIRRLMESDITKECCVQILPVIKSICLKKKNTEILMSYEFFVGLCNALELTHKVLIIPTIFKIMSKNEKVANLMGKCERMINLLLQLLNNESDVTLNKKTIVTVLYRISNTACGMNTISKEEQWNIIFQWFAKSESNERIPLYKLKAYSILNRCLNNRTIIPTENDLKYKLPAILDYQENESSSEESDMENDENDDLLNNRNSADSEPENYESDSSLEQNVINNRKSIRSELLSEEDFIWAEKLFRELSPNIDYDTKNYFRSSINKNTTCAYPDSLLEDSTIEDNSTIVLAPNNILLKYLSDKIQRIRQTSSKDLYGKVVYNIEDTSPNDDHETLHFESRFECGNLKTAIQIGPQEYNLILNSDTNSKKGHRWFYFMISNMIPDTKYYFNIINCLNVNSQFNQGLQPVIFSVTDYNLYGTGWIKAGDDISYYGNNFTDETRKKQLRTLTFSLKFRHDNDCIYIAYHYPYTYTRLMMILYKTPKTSSNLYFRLDNICFTIANKMEVPLLTITGNLENGPMPVEKRPIIFLTSRVHPGESNASWIIEGLIEFLLGENHQAVKARNYFLFKIIPMLNPEGVIFGNSRSSFTGYDLNRCWSHPHPLLHKEIFSCKTLIKYIRMLNRPVAAFIDIHGHSRKKHFFFYGCNPNESWQKRDALLGNLEEALSIIPKAIEKYHDGLKMTFCRNVIQKNRESTCRIVMWRQLGIQHSFTLECSYCTLDGKKAVTRSSLKEIGQSIIKGVSDVAEYFYSI